MSVSRNLQSAKSEAVAKGGDTPSESDPAAVRPDTKAVLQLDRISHVFAQRNEQLIAIANVSLNIREGEFVSIVGPSGCGKSTLLKIVSGLLVPTAGTVLFEGSPITQPRDEIGLMFQTPTLFPWRTTMQNITLPLEIRKAAGFDWDERVSEIIDLVRLKGFENHYPRELSGGMQQRVALSRLLVSDPHLMLLDEPFGALDEFTREHLNTELARVSEHEDKTTVFDVPIERPRVPASRRDPAFNETVLDIRETLDLV
jgi:NitT/TauT family transport system ATP-binding protein